MFFMRAVKSNDYYCNITLDHLLCNRNNGSSHCVDYKAIDVNDEMKKIIVDAHKDARNEIATDTFNGTHDIPPITNMLEISWSDLLALAAQKLTKRCALTLSTDKQREFPFFKKNPMLGQVLFPVENSTKPLKWKDFMKEITDIEKQMKNGFLDEKAPFQQVIWTDTYLIGCAQAGFKRNSTNTFIAACIYGPANEIYSHHNHDVGNPCSNCPDNGICSSNYPGLCSSKNLSRPTLSDYHRGFGEYKPLKNISGNIFENKDSLSAPQIKGDFLYLFVA